MTLCTGRGGTKGKIKHCCVIAGKVCPHLRENVASRRYACGLMIEFGSWESVIRSADYQPVGKALEAVGLPFEACMTWQPKPGQCCLEVRDGDMG